MMGDGTSALISPLTLQQGLNSSRPFQPASSCLVALPRELIGRVRYWMPRLGSQRQTLRDAEAWATGFCPRSDGTFQLDCIMQGKNCKQGEDGSLRRPGYVY